MTPDYGNVWRTTPCLYSEMDLGRFFVMMNRDQKLCRFQACTGIVDLDRCIAMLEQHKWNLNAAANAALDLSSSSSASTQSSSHGLEFSPQSNTDTMWRSGIQLTVQTKCQCITAMKEYEKKSFEELRLQKYAAKRRNPDVESLEEKFRSFGFAETAQNQQSMSQALVPQTSDTSEPSTSGLAVTSRISFNPPSGTDKVLRNGSPTTVTTKFQCITAMVEYERKSFEELRVEDYIAGRNGPREPVPFAEVFAGTGRSKFTPLVDTEPYMWRTISTKYCCITAMKEYEGKSLEELRLEDYIAGRKGPERPHSQGLGSPSSSAISGVNSTDRHMRVMVHTPLKGKGSFNPGDRESSSTKEKAGTASKPTAQKVEALDRPRCVVCLDGPVNAFFGPCGHVCCCFSCAKTFKKCPMCRKKILQTHKAYLP